MPDTGGLADPEPEGTEAARLEEVRRQLASLARNRRRRYSEWTPGAPCQWQPLQVVSPETGLPIGVHGAWEFAAQCLEDGCPLTEVVLEKPPGAIAYVMKPALGDRQLYIKLQLCKGRVLGRSFHYSESHRE